jgi:hypothetical protein
MLETGQYLNEYFMTHTFEITVQCKGNAVGTLGWLNSFLLDGELVVKECKDGSPGLFFHEKHDMEGKETTSNKCNTFICKVATDRFEPEYLYQGYNGVDIKCVNVIRGEMEYGFFGFPLTPSAFEKASEFLNSACSKFAEWWKQQ